ncbi:conserved hypothetical protein [Neospora caninum Liverpool]|uniref:Uncharacterized protein n=1 Tax=Neospora caninum (strain Liverpool) TaxID=572307 RepID=F0VRS7_NEOCL|nr:conserved hypothetical protein [Neospora caninum Liverpool]CBZ56425.1 conserved hypothetical protein [Neospora caninum Liverpool]CEL71184.1 TPA: hypothetical protein BN1204_068490 [Neospora caninum Liverpool]|eukprot:XP_003886450.1 conserved hypothetical protein [Neospora caninum Liverpool]
MTARTRFPVPPSPASPSTSCSSSCAAASAFSSTLCAPFGRKFVVCDSSLRETPSTHLRIPFLLPSLDRLLQGGCPVGEGILQICGPPGAGKTSLCLQLAASLAAGFSPQRLPPSLHAGCLRFASDFSPAGGSEHEGAAACGARSARRASRETAEVGGESDRAKRRRQTAAEPSVGCHFSSSLASSSSSSGPSPAGAMTTSCLPQAGSSREERRSDRQATHALANEARRHVLTALSGSAVSASSEKQTFSQEAGRRRRRALFLDSEGGGCPERVQQIVASLVGELFHSSERRESSPCTQLSEEKARPTESAREAEKAEGSSLLRGSCRTSTTQARTQGLLRPSEREWEGTRVEDEEKRMEREERDIRELSRRIDVVRIFDHKELLAVLQHVLCVLTNENEHRKGEAQLAKDGRDEANEETEQEGGDGVRAGRHSDAVPKAAGGARVSAPSRPMKRHRETYGLIVIDSLSSLYHPAFFHSAVECTASLIQSANLLTLLASRFVLAVVVTNQLTTSKAVFAPHGRDASTASFLGAGQLSSQTFTPSLGPAWQQIPLYSLGLRWPSGQGAHAHISASPVRKRSDSLDRSLAGTRQAISTREIVVFKAPTLFSAVGAETEEAQSEEGGNARAGEQEACSRNTAQGATALMPVAPICVYVNQRGIRECMDYGHWGVEENAI